MLVRWIVGLMITSAIAIAAVFLYRWKVKRDAQRLRAELEEEEGLVQ